MAISSEYSLADIAAATGNDRKNVSLTAAGAAIPIDVQNANIVIERVA